MKFFVVLVCIAAFIKVKNCQESLPSEADVDKILQNDRLLLNYHKCLVDGVGCTPAADKLRKNLPKYLENGCGKDACDEKTTAIVKKVVIFLMKEKPDLWKQLLAKYDPAGENVKKYEQMFKEN